MPKRELILDGVLELIFKSEDYSGITISQIAKEAGIGKGTIYEYFGSKKEIFFQAVTHYMTKRIEHLSGIVLQSESFKACAYGLISEFMDKYDENKLLMSFLFGTGEYGNKLCERFNEMLAQHNGVSLQLLRGAIQLAINDGLLDNQPSDRDLIFGTISAAGIITQYCSKHLPAFNDTLSPDEFKDYCIDMMLKILR